MQTPEVSILVPVYKVKETLLRKCIQSCLNQNNRNIEIVLVDDCSPDKCGRICDEYAQADNRVKVIHQEKNGGLSAARNAGVKNATGKWITFVDGDDWIDQTTCDLIHHLPNPNIEMVFFGMNKDYANTSEEMDFCYEDGKVFAGDECKALQIDVLNYYKRIATAVCKIVRRDFILQHHIFHDEELRYGIEGIEYSLRLLGNVQCVMSCNKHCYHYVYNPDSITGNPNESSNRYILLGIGKMKKYINSVNPSKALLAQFRKRVKRVVIDVSLGCYFNPNYKAGYKERVHQFKGFIGNREIAETLACRLGFDSGMINEVAYWFAKYRFYWGLSLMGKMRMFVLTHK